jgi:hypothetical protein
MIQDSKGFEGESRQKIASERNRHRLQAVLVKLLCEVRSRAVSPNEFFSRGKRFACVKGFECSIFECCKQSGTTVTRLCAIGTGRLFF